MKPIRREGTEFVKVFDPKKGDRIVGMCNFKDSIIVATEKGVYTLRRKK